MKEEIILSEKQADFELTMLFDKTPTKKLIYPLFFKIEDFRSRANFQNYTCHVIEKSFGSEIDCDFTGASGGRSLSFYFSSSDVIKIVNKRKMFRADVLVPVDTEKLVARTWLREGFVLMPESEDVSTIVPYSPRDGTSGSDGRKIYIVWIRENLERGDGLSISVVYEQVFPRAPNSLPFILASTFLLIVLVFALRLGSKIWRLPLREDELAVVEVLRSHGGSTKQRQIVRETGFNKVKVSRLIKSLQERGVVSVEHLGRTNRITLRRGIR
jgi:hypothetical protein